MVYFLTPLTQFFLKCYDFPYLCSNFLTLLSGTASTGWSFSPTSSSSAATKSSDVYCNSSSSNSNSAESAVATAAIVVDLQWRRRRRSGREEDVADRFTSTFPRRPLSSLSSIGDYADAPEEPVKEEEEEPGDSLGRSGGNMQGLFFFF